jgi:hypothetical protein
MIDYWKIGVAGLLLLGAFATGWGLRNRDFNDYKREIANVAKAQEEKVKSIRSQQELVNKGIEDEYNAKLALLRQYYANGVRQPSSSSMPTISNTTSGLDAITAYNLLAGQCSQSTLQLVELQKWINEQIGIK